MQSPMGIKFADDCLTVLSQTLLAEAPNEGCALLIGSQKQSSCFKKENTLQIQLIWPCCNIWEPGISKLLESQKKLHNTVKEKISKKNRFIIDPREQILAQRWARERNLTILGSAHSHPSGTSIPSLVDCIWSIPPRLMVIVGQFGEVRAWWVSAEQNFHPKKVAIWESK